MPTPLSDAEKESLQRAADSGHLSPELVKAQNDLKLLRAFLQSSESRLKCANLAASCAGAIDKCRPQDVERLARFFFEFLNQREVDHATSSESVSEVRGEHAESVGGVPGWRNPHALPG
jgi:hypothetical protein